MITTLSAPNQITNTTQVRKNTPENPTEALDKPIDVDWNFPDHGFFIPDSEIIKKEPGLTAGSMPFNIDTTPGTSPIPDTFVKAFDDDFKPFWTEEDTTPGTSQIPEIFTNTSNQTEIAKNVIQAAPDQMINALSAMANGGKDLFGGGVDLVQQIIGGEEKPQEPKTKEEQEQIADFNFKQNTQAELARDQRMAVAEAENILSEAAQRWSEGEVSKTQIEAETGQKITSQSSLMAEVNNRIAKMHPDEHPDLVQSQALSNDPTVDNRLNTTGEQVGQSVTTLVG